MFNKGSKCGNCNSRIKGEFSFCPYCGSDIIDRDQERKDFGLLGRNDSAHDEIRNQQGDFGFIFKMLGPVFNKLIKEMEKDMQRGLGEMFERGDVQNFPNGIKIRIGPPGEKKKEKKNKSPEEKLLTSEQIRKMDGLPRAPAKSSVKRLNNKIVYELKTPGVESPEDIFISKLEKGYEIKAIGSRRVYVNNLSVELPLGKLSLIDGKLLVEFNADN